MLRVKCLNQIIHWGITNKKIAIVSDTSLLFFSDDYEAFFVSSSKM